MTLTSIASPHLLLPLSSVPRALSAIAWIGVCVCSQRTVFTIFNIIASQCPQHYPKAGAWALSMTRMLSARSLLGREQRIPPACAAEQQRCLAHQDGTSGRVADSKERTTHPHRVCSLLHSSRRCGQSNRAFCGLMHIRCAVQYPAEQQLHNGVRTQPQARNAEFSAPTPCYFPHTFVRMNPDYYRPRNSTPRHAATSTPFLVRRPVLLAPFPL